MLLLGGAFGLLIACAVVPGSAPTRASPTASARVGYLEGHASIGPLTPLEQIGTPPPTPSQQVCLARGLIILASDGMTVVTSFHLLPDCTYRVALPPGSYIVQLKPEGGVSRDLPKTVQILRGQSVRLDLTIDTGIR
jgi:hypothetical protein